jgi:hypothetical protein
MIIENPQFIEDKINFALKNYQTRMDPDRQLLNDVFIAKLM